MNDIHIIRSENPSYDIPEITVGQYIWNQLQELNGDSVCLIEANSGSQLTINELKSKSQSIGRALIDTGIVDKNDIIVTFADNSIEHSIVLFSVVFLGTTLYPITSIANIYELENLFKSLPTFVLITSQSKAEQIRKVLAKNENQIKIKTLIVLDGISENDITFNGLLKVGDNRSLDKTPYFHIDIKNDNFVLFQSSGTSGPPKSVILSHRAFLAILLDFKDFLYVEKPIFAHMTPFGCISGVTFILFHISLGIPVIVFSDLSDDSILKAIDKYRVNYMYLTPFFAHKLIDDNLVNKYDLSSLRHIITGGSPFNADVGRAIVQKYDLFIKESYGMTEFFPITNGMKVTDNCKYKPQNEGKVVTNCEMKIIDINSGLSLGPDSDGEICVRGPKMFSGYLNNEAATHETIDSEGWLHTGDIGHYDQNKDLFITDRLKELIKYMTKQVSPTEIEQFLLTHNCVAEVAVVGVNHRTENQWPRAYIKLNENMSATEEEIMKYVSDNLNSAKQLRAGIHFVDYIPRTTIGKVNRKYFKTLVANELIG